jgi:hypothetical protein
LLGVVAAFAVFFVFGYLFIFYVPPFPYKNILATVLIPGASWATLYLAGKFIPATCPKCGESAFCESVQRIRYTCRGCKHVVDLGFSRISNDSP